MKKEEKGGGLLIYSIGFISSFRRVNATNLKTMAKAWKALKFERVNLDNVIIATNGQYLLAMV